MKLLTKEIENLFKKYGRNSQDETPLMERKVLAKFFNPYGVGTWIILECEEKTESGDYILYGLCSLGYGYELGYVSLNELASIKIKPFNLGIERDMYLPKDCKVKDLIEESELM